MFLVQRYTLKWLLEMHIFTTWSGTPEAFPQIVQKQRTRHKIALHLQSHLEKCMDHLRLIVTFSSQQICFGFSRFNFFDVGINREKKIEEIHHHAESSRFFYPDSEGRLFTKRCRFIIICLSHEPRISFAVFVC
jgi:hypothetical protein